MSDALPNDAMNAGLKLDKPARERRKRLTREQRRLIWEHLDSKYGLPRRCHVVGCEGPPTLDHINGDRNDQRIINFRPACPRHQKGPPWLSISSRERIRADEPYALTTNADSAPFGSYESKKNAMTEPAFRAWVIGRLVQNGGGGLSWDYFVEDGAEIYRVMQVTTDRYLRKLTAPSGPLRVDSAEIAQRIQRLVSLKPEFYKQAGQYVESSHPPAKSEVPSTDG